MELDPKPIGAGNLESCLCHGMRKVSYDLDIGPHDHTQSMTGRAFHLHLLCTPQHNTNNQDIVHDLDNKSGRWGGAVPKIICWFMIKLVIGLLDGWDVGGGERASRALNTTSVNHLGIPLNNNNSARMRVTFLTLFIGMKAFRLAIESSVDDEVLIQLEG
jgi:hypothetical protein